MGRKKQKTSIYQEVIDNSISEKILAKDYEGIKGLISKGYNLHSRNSEGQSPLEVALLNSDFGMAILLIDNGADVNATSRLGLTYFHIIIRQLEKYLELGHSQEEIMSLVEKLLNKGTNLSIQERRGNTAINSIAQLAKANRPLTTIYTKLAKLLLSLDKNVSMTIQIKNNMGKAPMDYLARNGNVILRETIYEKLPSVQNRISEELKQKNLEIKKLIELDKELVR